MPNRKRNIQMKFWVTEEEKSLIDEKMKLLPTRRYGAYLRKMDIDEYIIYTDTANIKEFTAKLSAIGKNINQIAKKLNAGALLIRQTWTKSRKGWSRYGSYKDTSYQVYNKGIH